MNTFLWTIAILGMIELGSSIAFWLTGRVPDRTIGGSLISGIFWAILAAWAISLIQGAA